MGNARAIHLNLNFLLGDDIDQSPSTYFGHNDSCGRKQQP